MLALPFWRITLAAAISVALSIWGARAECPAFTRSGVPRVVLPGRDPQLPKALLTSTSQVPIWKTITVGEYKGVTAIRVAIDASPCPVRVGEAAGEILGRPAFPYKQTRAQLDLAVVPIAELGFGENGASVRDIYARALGIGLELCPAEVGPTLRLNYLDQPVGEFLDIAMHPIARYNGELINFTVGNGGAGLLLIGGDGRPDLVLPGAVRFVFVRPRPDQLVSPPDGELAGR